MLASVAAPAFAEEADGAVRYAGASSFNWDLNGGDGGKGSGARLSLGQQLSPYIGVEAHAGMGGGSSIDVLIDDGVNPPVPRRADAELDQLLGVYLRAQYPFNDFFTVYGLYGYTRAKVNIDVESALGSPSFSETQSGGSYGGGVDFKVLSGVLDGKLRITLDYMVYLDQSGGEFVARSAGLRLDF